MFVYLGGVIILKEGKQKNMERFTGFADIYDMARPSVPDYPVQIVCKYLERSPETVVDMGCGTGLSTVVWSKVCKNVIGVEPSKDMLAIAKSRESDTIKFVQAFSDDTPFSNNYADVVVCSQSFHWMEPTSTLKEVNRILKEGGIFATIDCDWPPVANWRAESEYMQLQNKVRDVESGSSDINDTFVRYPKENHLKNISDSGYFRYARELVFANTESCTAERFVDILISQGSLQTILKKSPEMIEADIDKFSYNIKSIFADSTFEIEFSYRMRIGIK